MKIRNEILHELLEHMPEVPPEAGGIIGGKDGRVCLWEYDAGYDTRGCAYCPNVDSLNKVIETWVDQGYNFMGILHVHFGGSKTLSDSDKQYIEKIMRAMPDSIRQLYFPIVVQPEKQLVPYVAYRNQLDEVTIITDKLEEIF